MSTRESIAPRETPLLNSRVNYTASQSVVARILSGPLQRNLIYLICDLLAITVAHMLSVRLVEHFLRLPMNVLNPFEYHRFYIPFFVVVLYLFEGYKSPEIRRPEQELERSCKALAVSFLGLVLFNFIVFRSEPFSRYLLGSWFAIALVLLLVARFSLRAIYNALWSRGLCRRRALLLGSAAGLAEYEHLLSIQRHHGYELAGILLDSRTEASSSKAIPGAPLLGALDQWEKALSETHANVLIVAYRMIPYGEDWLHDILNVCKRLRVDVELYSSILATSNLNYEHDEFSGCFRFYSKPQWSLAVQRVLKRGIDVLIGMVGSAVTLLLIPIVYVLINLEDRGPLFYRSAYVGQDGSTRYYLKFRTMQVDADRILETDEVLRARFREQQKLADDPRITAIGRLLRKSSLDEFPQFFSVLKGDLTFVGPRTIRQEEAARYGPLLGKLFSVKPGVTGFWQVMGRQTTTYQERMYMDMFYVERWSIWLDLVIIGKTFWKVVKAEGAY